MPIHLAARKCPSSCTKTSTPSTKTNDKTVIKPATSDLQFYRARHLERIRARTLVGRAHLRQRRHLGRFMRVHGPLDDLRNRHEADPPLEEPRDGDLVRSVEDHRQTPLRLERAVSQTQARKRVRV